MAHRVRSTDCFITGNLVIQFQLFNRWANFLIILIARKTNNFKHYLLTNTNIMIVFGHHFIKTLNTWYEPVLVFTLIWRPTWSQFRVLQNTSKIYKIMFFILARLLGTRIGGGCNRPKMDFCMVCGSIRLWLHIRNKILFLFRVSSLV